MTPHENEHENEDQNTPNASPRDVHDAQIAAAFFNEEEDQSDPALQDDPDVRDRMNRWSDALAVLDELDDLPVAAAIAPWQTHQPSPAPAVSRWSRWTSSTWFRTGLAASIILLIGLLFVGTEFRASDGTFVVRFGPIGRSTPIAMNGGPAQSQWVRADEVDQIVRQQTDDRLASFIVDLAEAFSSMEQRRRADDAALVNAILQLRQADLQRLDRIMQGLADQSAQQTQITRNSISHLLESGLLRLSSPDDNVNMNQKDLY